MKVFIAKSYTWQANSYLAYDENNDAIIIDPNLQDNGMEKFIYENHLNVKAVCCTHGHFDHISGVDYYVNKYKCKFYISEKDVEMLTDPYKNSSEVFGLHIICHTQPTNLFKSFTVVTELKDFLTVIATPFHTQGGVCLVSLTNHIAFVGDTLFKGGIGRTDLYSGDSSQIEESLHKLSQLPKDTICYPGHGDETTIGHEFY